MKSTFFRKIIWAVDVLEDSDQQRNVLLALSAVSRPSDAQIEPVFILGSPFAQLAATPQVEIEQAYHALADKRLLELYKHSDIPNMTPGKVLVSRSGSIRMEVQTLIEYAEKSEVDLIVVATHARRGIKRIMLGSFAETLVLHSKIPVITVNPEMKVKERISTILFPTTFQNTFRGSFERVVEFARVVEANLTLYYKEPKVPGPYRAPELDRVIAEEMELRTKRAKDWQSWARQAKVSTEIVLDSQPGDPIDSIQDFAVEKKFDLIAVPSQANAFSAVLAGSVARGLMRSGPCPVWVMHVEPTESTRAL